MQQAMVITDPAAVGTRLAELGLSEGLLRRVLLHGDAAGRDCTIFDPPNAAGYLRWMRSVGRLREELASEGWTPDDHLNLPRAVSPNGRLSIIVATGDAAVGDSKATPSTRYRRGDASRRAIEINVHQLALFPVDALADPKLPEALRDERVTFFLLFAVDQDQIHSELSCPSKLSEDGRPISWAERIILPPIDRGAGFQVTIDEPTQVDVDVRRRTAE